MLSFKEFPLEMCDELRVQSLMTDGGVEGQEYAGSSGENVQSTHHRLFITRFSH